MEICYQHLCFSFDCLQKRLHEQAEGAELWLEDVKAAVKETLALSDEARNGETNKYI